MCFTREFILIPDRSVHVRESAGSNGDILRAVLTAGFLEDRLKE